MFLGFIAILIIAIIFLSIDQGVDIDENTKYEAVFPVYRGLIMIALFLWMFGINVYSWIKCSINYTLILEFNTHYDGASDV